VQRLKEHGGVDVDDVRASLAEAVDVSMMGVEPF
jgi:hypothetical protein